MQNNQSDRRDSQNSPTTPRSRRVWTAEDEARLEELTSRKQSIMGENLDRLRDIMSEFSPHSLVETQNEFDQLVEYMRIHAAPIREALLPFVNDTSR